MRLEGDRRDFYDHEYSPNKEETARVKKLWEPLAREYTYGVLIEVIKDNMDPGNLVGTICRTELARRADLADRSWARKEAKAAMDSCTPRQRAKYAKRNSKKS